MTPPRTIASDTISCTLQAAQEIFCESGYRASIDAVATRAGVARQTIYNNFGNKQQLFSQAIERGMGDFWAELVCHEGDLRTQLETFGLRFRAKILNPEMARLHIMLTSEANRFPEQARDFFDKAILGTRRQLALVIANFMDEGLLQKDDPLDAAHLFIDALLGFDQARLHYAGEAPDPAHEIERVQKHVSRFLRAYAP